MNILREARKFPSVKRDGIVNEIREGTSLCSRSNDDFRYRATYDSGFRENRHLEDPDEIQLQIDVALNGLGQIRQFTRLDKSSPNWNFHTFSNPVRLFYNFSSLSLFTSTKLFLFQIFQVTAFQDAEKQREQYLFLEEFEQQKKKGLKGGTKKHLDE